MDAMDNEEALRLLAHGKLRDGRLPHDRFTVVWSGPSDGETCDACDVLLTNQHVLMEGTRGRRAPSRSSSLAFRIRSLSASSLA